MKLINIMILCILVITGCGSDSPLGKYQKEKLSNDIEIRILSDDSSEAAGKNQLTVELNKKVSLGQIVTISDSLYKTKERRNRFYIFFMLPGMKPDAGNWSSAIFNPDLEIEMDNKQPPALTTKQRKVAEENNKKFEELSESVEKDSTLNN